MLTEDHFACKDITIMMRLEVATEKRRLCWRPCSYQYINVSAKDKVVRGIRCDL